MASPFRPARELLVHYARSHRDRRNIATHFVGIPLIVFALGALLARPAVAVDTAWGALALTPALLLWALGTLWYLTRGEFVLGLAVSLATGALVLLAAPLAQDGTGLWLGGGFGLLALGRLFQILGHYYEGRRPAWAGDLTSLLVGPAFVTAEALFALGWGQGLRQEIERRAGPTHLRDLALPA